ncbi:MAG: HipA protein [uncultured bacterium]|nr:MAG: HipA protein [uncultured bacterium]
MLKTPHQEWLVRIRQFLTRSGPSSAGQICTALGISQPVLSRVCKRLTADLLVFGRARATVYAWRREILGLPAKLPLYEITQAGGSTLLATLYPIQPEGFWVESSAGDKAQQYHRDLPYFLDDMRPSGFLGRLLAKQYAFLNQPQDIRLWSAADCLRFLASHGWDMPGNLIVGDVALQNYLNSKTIRMGAIVKDQQKKRVYEKMAEHILEMGPAGSSAGGEQPKFLANIHQRSSVLVKFSPPLGQPVSQRIADLLVCEHLAQLVLALRDIVTTQSQIIRGKKRVFLELTRFDRTKAGRLGMISLQALNLEYVGSTGSWPDVSEALCTQGVITKDVHRNICVLDLFGRLIANTDRHFGNISFLSRQLGIIGIAPVYDMLPMAYMPQHEQMKTVSMEMPAVSRHDMNVMMVVSDAALEFWRRVGESKLITPGFKKIAAQNEKIVSGFKQHFVTQGG